MRTEDKIKNCKAWKIINSHWIVKELRKHGFVIIHRSKLKELQKIAGGPDE